MVMSEDWVKGILTITSAIACTTTFLLCLFKGKLSKLNFWDVLVMIVGFIALFIWWWFQSATYGNLVFQLCITISFIPTYRGVWKNPNIESKLPWLIWSFAYVISTTVVFMRWQGQFQDLAFHLFGLFLHLGVGIICIKKLKIKIIS